MFEINLPKNVYQMGKSNYHSSNMSTTNEMELKNDESCNGRKIQNNIEINKFHSPQNSFDYFNNLLKLKKKVFQSSSKNQDQKKYLQKQSKKKNDSNQKKPKSVYEKNNKIQEIQIQLKQQQTGDSHLNQFQQLRQQKDQITNQIREMLEKCDSKSNTKLKSVNQQIQNTINKKSQDSQIQKVIDNDKNLEQKKNKKIITNKSIGEKNDFKQKQELNNVQKSLKQENEIKSAKQLQQKQQIQQENEIKSAKLSQQKQQIQQDIEIKSAKIPQQKQQINLQYSSAQRNQKDVKQDKNKISDKIQCIKSNNSIVQQKKQKQKSDVIKIVQPKQEMKQNNKIKKSQKLIQKTQLITQDEIKNKCQISLKNDYQNYLSKGKGYIEKSDYLSQVQNKQEKSVIKIQSLFRGYQQRKLKNKFFMQKDKSIQDIQNSYCLFDDDDLSAIPKINNEIKNEIKNDQKFQLWDNIKKQIQSLDQLKDTESQQLLQNLEQKILGNNKINVKDLQINIEIDNEQKQDNLSPIIDTFQLENNQIIRKNNQMRQFLGSEQLLRESWEQMDSQLIASNNFENLLQSKDIENVTQTPVSSNKIFFKFQPFQEFIQQKFKEMMVKENMDKLIDARQQMLNLRHQTQKDAINQLFKKQKFTPNIYDKKHKELEIWVQKEMNDLQKTKSFFEKNWQLTTKTLKKTQRDIQFINKLCKPQDTLNQLNTVGSDEECPEQLLVVKDNYDQQDSQLYLTNNSQIQCDQDHYKNYIKFENQCEQIYEQIILEQIQEIQQEVNQRNNHYYNEFIENDYEQNFQKQTLQQLLEQNQKNNQNTNNDKVQKFLQKKKLSPQNSIILNEKIQVDQEYINQYFEILKDYLIKNAYVLLNTLNQDCIQHKLKLLNLNAQEQQQILTQNIFQQIEKQIQESQNPKQQQLQTIFNQLLFDSVNEYFNLARNQNQPNNSLMSLFNDRPVINLNHLEIIISQILNNSFIESQFLCGFLDIHQQFDQNQLIRIRDEKMTQLIQQQLVQFEQSLIYGQQEVQISLQISLIIFDELIDGLIFDLDIINKKRQIQLNNNNINNQ